MGRTGLGPAGITATTAGTAGVTAETAGTAGTAMLGSRAAPEGPRGHRDRAHPHPRHTPEQELQCSSHAGTHTLQQARPLPVLRLLLVAVVLLVLGAGGAEAAPFTFTDVYTPRCTPLANPPPGGFKKWSDPKTWGPGGVPGVGSRTMVNVTIPCGGAVVLDVPEVRVNMLTIRGMLAVQDPAKGKPAVYQVTACLVLVEGQLIVGSAKKQLRSKLTFTLAPNPNRRKQYSFTFNPPADKDHPRGIGHKAFVIAGGQVSLHGMPGEGGTPSWVKLAETAKQGQNYIILDTDVTGKWPVGGRIAIASTGYYAFEAEEFEIVDVQRHPKGTALTLDKALQWSHWGNARGIPDGFGGFVDERAEVALLSRNIVITGVDEPAPYQYEGGHFMVFMTRQPQTIEGVEFFKMGQQGKLGRYSIHLHVCGDTRGQMVVRKNAIHSSKQRCIVVHATHNASIESNVAYNTAGHCFMVEEGGEQGNKFIGNLGFLTRRVDRLITNGYLPGSTLETDNVPSTFWISNLYNTYVGNVAGGSDDTGFWAELRANVRGMSLYIPGLEFIRPRYSQFQVMRDNVAHSNGYSGFRCYPHGINPRKIFDAASPVPISQWPVGNGRIVNFRSFKNGDNGLFMHSSSDVLIINATFADNNYGVDINDNYRGGVINSRFLGLSPNYGSLVPSWCTGPNGPTLCAPIKGCKLYFKDTSNLRLTGGSPWKSPRFGIIIRHFRIVYDGGGPFTLRGNRFAGYQPTCGEAVAAIGVGLQGIAEDGLQWWNDAQSVQQMRVSPGSNPLWFSPQKYKYPQSSLVYSAGETGLNYAIWDKDGGVVGGKGGYLIGTDPFLRPPKSIYTCKNLPASNALACPGACYRTLHITFVEPGFKAANRAKPRARGDFSFMTFKRIKDGVSRTTDGNLNDLLPVKGVRNFIISLLAPAEYEVTLHPPSKKPNWAPQSLSIGYRDAGGCGKGVTVTLNPVGGKEWRMTPSNDQFWSPCAGTTYVRTPVVQYSRVCQRGATSASLQLSVGGKLGTYLTAYSLSNPLKASRLPAGIASASCGASLQCGVHGSSDWYWYSTPVGKDPRSPAPETVGFQIPLYRQGPEWRKGRAIIGKAGWPWSEIRSLTGAPNSSALTFYYRKAFDIRNTACYKALELDYFVTQGLVVYLNGVELFRFNMPQGPVKGGTLALRQNPWPGNTPGSFSTAVIDLTKSAAALVEGRNYLAFETHVAGPWQAYSFFDTRVSLLLSSASCKGPKKRPEVCDGLDNDSDGTADVDPKTRRLLTRPCATACGKGTETCYLGAYQRCTAPRVRPETCNGKDDNCDGAVDNGGANATLCGKGFACFQGQCLRKTTASSQVTVMKAGSSGWYYKAGGNPRSAFPKWTVGSPSKGVLGAFKKGKAPFGTQGAPSGPLTTALPGLKKGETQYYFLFPYSLSAVEAAATHSLAVRVRRAAGAVVFANGVPIYSTNMPSWFDPKDPGQQAVYALDPNSDVKQWYTNTPTKASGHTGGGVQAGANWIAATVAVSSKRPWEAFLDLEVSRNLNNSCALLPGKPKACIRVANNEESTVLLPFYSDWRYSDASRSVPTKNWKGRNYDDSGWPTKQAILGNRQGNQSRIVMTRSRIAYYFRKALYIPDGHCYFQLQGSIRAVDGAVFYINGVEAYRFQFDPDITTVTSKTYSSHKWPASSSGTFFLEGAWLRKGRNVMAAELHLSSQNTGNWFFDFSISGQREAVSCSPPPLQ